MAPIDATALLRPGLLEDLALLVAGPPSSAPNTLGVAVARAFSGLGASVSTCVPNAEDESQVDRCVADALTQAGALHILAVDGAGLFAHALGAGAGPGDSGEGAPTALRACMDATWNITRAVVNLAFLAPQPEDPARRVARIVYLAPSPNAGKHARAVCAGLENLARTLSVEWARHGIAIVAIAPGARTSEEELAAVTAYLASPAGAYFTGCLLDLGGAAGPLR
jgi:NAD(P)-dependent dehydrogenase (short-subunit alcohol dehydrogenase family)